MLGKLSMKVERWKSGVGILVCMLCPFGQLLAEPESVNITDTQGRSLKGQFLTSDGTTLSFKRAGNPKSFSMPIATLSEETQAQIKT
jgi:hypothetical protein